jgi:hypothetical protein
MHFDEDRSAFVIDEGRELPVVRYGHDDTEMPAFSPLHPEPTVTHFRQVIVAFENRWTLSIIWGDHTYSANYNAWMGRDWQGNPAPPFTDEPGTVEVGILMPEPVTLPAQTFELRSGPVEWPERETELWGDPLNYVDAEALWWLAMDEVSKWPSDPKPRPEDGPYIHAASPTGPFMLTINEYSDERNTADDLSSDCPQPQPRPDG